MQQFIDRAISEWHHQLEYVVQQQGRHIETHSTLTVNINSKDICALSQFTVLETVQHDCNFKCFELVSASSQYARIKCQ